MPKLKKGQGKKSVINAFKDMKYPPVKKKIRDKGYKRLT